MRHQMTMISALFYYPNVYFKLTTAQSHHVLYIDIYKNILLIGLRPTKSSVS